MKRFIPARIGLLLCVVCMLGFSYASLYKHHPSGLLVKPVGEEENRDEKQARIRAYNAIIHRAAPGVDWRAIELQNAYANAQYRLNNSHSKVASAFAGGLINGTWYERGNSNTAGRMSAFAYNPATNALYGMSDAGSLWQTTPTSSGWTLLNDRFMLRSKILALTPLATGGTRLLMANDTNVVYSDDAGATLHPASGITFPVAWGGNYVDHIVVLNDAAHTVYALVQGWNSSPWGARIWLFRSTDRGQTFTKVFTFSNTATNQVSLFAPYNSSQLYALCVNPTTSDSLFAVSGSTVSLMNATAAFPAVADKAVLTGLMVGTSLRLYALVDDNRVYQSANSGASWQLMNTLTADSWHLLASSAKIAGNLLYGNIEAFRSTDSGTSFTKVNNWGDYYAAPATKLHADMQTINFFQDISGAEFCIIGTDGGAYYSNDYLATVSNLSLNGLLVNELWNHITSPLNPNVLFSGMQDQGLCHTMLAGGTGTVTQNQIISGDYGQMCITADSLLWAEYPGGNMYLYHNMNAPAYVAKYSLQGTQKSNAAWMMPTAKIPGTTANEILLGGGNITGGAGSYLARLKLSGGTVSATQYPFDFRAASGSGTSGLSSVAVSALNPNLWYAGTEDGTFFWSRNAGAAWTKALAFTGVSGFWLYGACIAPSKVLPGTVYYAGSGYSNPPVYISADSGQTFTAMSTGLPRTLVNGLAVSPKDSLIFAATDAGPYVYIKAQGQWYPLLDTRTPGCSWKSVEFLPATNTARFSTYGRGVWDFKMVQPAPQNSVTASTGTAHTRLYPNPVRSGGKVSIEGGNAGTYGFILADMNGRVIMHRDVSAREGIQLPELVPGLYGYGLQQNSVWQKGLILIK